MKIIVFLIMIVLSQTARSSDDVLHLKVGFIQKISCNGRLYVSAVGNDSLVRLEALPKELGCAVILKPTGIIGTTNLILETSTGTVMKRLEVSR